MRGGFVAQWWEFFCFWEVVFFETTKNSHVKRSSYLMSVYGFGSMVFQRDLLVRLRHRFEVRPGSFWSTHSAHSRVPFLHASEGQRGTSVESQVVFNFLVYSWHQRFGVKKWHCSHWHLENLRRQTTKPWKLVEQSLENLGTNLRKPFKKHGKNLERLNFPLVFYSQKGVLFGDF